MSTYIKIVSIWEFSRDIVQATGILPVIAVVVGGGLVLWGGLEIWSAIQDWRLRDANKPIER